MDTHPAFNSYYEKLADGTVRCIDSEIPFEIPDSWAWARIRDISKSYIGLTYRPTDVCSDGTIVLRSSNIQDGKLRLSDIVRVNTPISDKLWVEENDIIICARNGSKKLVGKSAIVDELKEPMTFGAFMAICKTQFYKFVFLYLQSECFFGQLRDVSGTTTINQLTQNNFNNFLIPLPPIEEQKRIIEKANSLLPIIGTYGSAQEALDSLNYIVNGNLKKSILQEAIQGRLVSQIASEGTAEELLAEIAEEKKRLFKEGKLKKSALTASRIFRGDDNKYYEQIGSQILDITEEIQYDIPDNWRWCRLGDIAMLRLGKTPPRGELIYWKPEKYNWVSISDMRDGEVITQTKEFISEKGAELFQGRISPKGSLLMSFKLTIGKISELGIDAYHNEAIITILPFFNQLVWFKYFLPMIAQSGETKDAIKGKTLNSKSLAALLIPLPPLSEQNRIVAQIETLLECIK